TLQQEQIPERDQHAAAASGTSRRPGDAGTTAGATGYHKKDTVGHPRIAAPDYVIAFNKRDLHPLGGYYPPRIRRDTLAFWNGPRLRFSGMGFCAGRPGPRHTF